MAKITDMTFTGKSGTAYSFGLYPRETTFKALGGIYAFTKEKPDGKHTVIYIGQTGDLSERFDDHHKNDCFDKNGANFISVLLEDSEAKRLKIETDLVDNYSPTCNG
jgi:excinuclease UvrABC nuclease subunit